MHYDVACQGNWKNPPVSRPAYFLRVFISSHGHSPIVVQIAVISNLGYKKVTGIASVATTSSSYLQLLILAKWMASHCLVRHTNTNSARGVKKQPPTCNKQAGKAIKKKKEKPRQRHTKIHITWDTMKKRERRYF